MVVSVEYDDEFKKMLSKIKDSALKERIVKLIEKIAESPDIGKPMRYGRKGTREVYVAPFRISYSYLADINTVHFLDLYHKDEQ